MAYQRLEYQRNWRKKNPLRLKKYSKKAALYKKKWGTLHQFSRRIKRFYGVTIEWYREHSKNGCEICGAQAKKRRLHVDHNHNTGEARGVLCQNCNLMLRAIEAGPNFICNAINYLLASDKTYRKLYGGQ